MNACTWHWMFIFIHLVHFRLFFNTVLNFISCFCKQGTNFLLLNFYRIWLWTANFKIVRPLFPWRHFFDVMWWLWYRCCHLYEGKSPISNRSVHNYQVLYLKSSIEANKWKYQRSNTWICTDWAIKQQLSKNNFFDNKNYIHSAYQTKQTNFCRYLTRQVQGFITNRLFQLETGVIR